MVIGQSPSPSLKQNSLPPESDLPAGNDFPPGSDRGRFPAQRRRRGGSTKVSTSRKSGTPKGFVEPAAEIQIAGNHESPVPPEIGIPTPKVGQIFPDPGSQSMQQAMKQFHQNSESPTAKAQPIPGSNVQVTTKTSTRPPNATMPTAPSTQFAPSQSAPSQSAPSQPAPAQPTPAQPAPAQPAPAQPALAQPAPPPKSGGTYWPESKKKALAEAAQIALTATPPNQAIRITTQEIHELLDQNPSYTQMCEILEYRGFIIDRGQFARILLKAVPDLGSASSPNNATSTNTASATRATPSNATPTVTASKDDTNTKLTSATPTAGSSGMVVKATSNGSAAQKKIHQPLWYSVPPGAEFQAPHGYVTPYDPNPPSMGQARNGYQSSGLPRDYRFVNHAARTPPEQRHNANITNQPCPNESALHFHPSFSLPQQPESTYGHVLDQNGPTYPNGTISHHPTKQEMARKRTFGEIVDLTQILSDDEELERHRPKARTDNGNAFVPSKSIKNIFDQVAQRQQNSGRTTPKPFKYKYSGRDALLQSYDIIEPMNKRRDALRRSTYNPKTIARDVLLGIGKHPTMAPLNAHLDVLKDRFKAVDYESDLSKFRWDLVDPEGEAKAQPSDTDEDPVPAVSAAPPQRPAPIAVMIDGDGGNTVKDDRTPTLKENSMATPYKRGPYKTKGIRSEIKQIGSADKTQRQSSQGSPSAQNTSNVPSINTPDLSRFAYNSPSTPQTDSTTLNAIISSTPGNSSNRKGRPPGAKNKQARPDKGISKKPKASYAGETSSAAKANPSGEETVKKKTPSIGKTSPFGIFLNGKPSAPVPSRPRFTPTTPSRPNDPRSPSSVMTSKDGIAVVIPSRSPSVVMFTPQTSAEKIRPKKTKDLSKSTQSSTTSYIMYRCHWEKCPAELHSLETLKKHVRKHRRAVDGVFPCLWADCSDSSNPVSNNTQNEDGQYRRLKFKTEAEWIQHVEINHFSTLMRSSGGGYC